MLFLVKINIYIVLYNDKKIEEVNRELSKAGNILKHYRSSIVRSFHYYVIDSGEKLDIVYSIVSNLKDKGLISWFKIEKI